MKKTIVSILIGSTCFLSCTKSDILLPVAEPCIVQTGNPAGKSYISDSVVDYTCTNKHCGILPLSTKNYWVYEDSIFTDGVLQQVRMDTLRFQDCKKSSDGLVWWETDMNIGLPATLYASDSTFFGLADRMFTPGIMDVKKEFGLFPGDSVKYLGSFEDAAATCRGIRMQTTYKTEAGDFNDGIYFEKLARNYRRDQVYFKPGIGVMKYIQEKAPMGTRTLKLQQVSTLVSYHIE
ncbi:MAG: hypothetical protein HOP10_14500 [Chitinophagaceae bacterium]|nr:hypothetical protein [Chitinophagaceae bacterium]